MLNIQTDDQCQHPGCKCPRPAADDYCGEYCRDAQQGGMDNDCKCAHQECAAGS